MAKTIEVFDTVRITEFGIKFKGDDEATSFGCVGKIEGESEVTPIVKKCEGIEKSVNQR